MISNSPRTNGKTERFIRTALEQWAYARPYHTSRERTAALIRFLNFYNGVRPHGALGQKTPRLRLAELLSVNNDRVNHI